MPRHVQPGSILYRALQTQGGAGNNGLILVADFLVPSLTSRSSSRRHRGWSSPQAVRCASTSSLSVPSPVGTKAFNVILGGIVDLNGSKEGKRLWDIWCQEPLGVIHTSKSPPKQHEIGASEKIQQGTVDNTASSTVSSAQNLEISTEEFEQGVESPDANALRPPDHALSDPEAWVELIDRFLPQQLRSKASQERLADAAPSGSRRQLVTILSRARRQHNVDILAYMGCTLGRWQAVLWIITNWVNRASLGKELVSREILRNGANLPQNQSLSELTASPTLLEIRKETARKPLRSLDGITEYDPAFLRVGRSKLYRELLSELWQSIGHMAIIAGNSSEQEAHRILTFVRQILAHCHHVGVVSNTIYRYIPDAELPVLHKPPTLHLLSSRILASLSDASWRASEEEVLAEAKQVGAEFNYKGYQLPGARYKLKVRELGPEVWLEFVLWSCVEDRLIGASAWLLKKMSESEVASGGGGGGGGGGQNWSVINWETIRQSATKGNGNKTGLAKIDLARVESQRDVAAGSLEAYSRLPPVVHMGERTISSEVVEAVIDGLIETVMTGNRVQMGSITGTIESITLLQRILERDGFSFSTDLWHMALLRFLENTDKLSDTTVRLLETIISLGQTFNSQDNPSAPPAAKPLDNSFEMTAATVGLCHRALRSLIKFGKIQAATRLFHRLHVFIQGNKQAFVAEISKELEEINQINGLDQIHPATASDAQETTTPFDQEEQSQLLQTQQTTTAIYQSQISPSLLASYLDLITESKCFELGHQLLNGTEHSKPLISPALYSHEALTPALLRFAAATTNSSLLAEVAKSLSPPLPDHFLRALLRCQISLSNWDNAEELMDYCQHVHRVKWMAGDAAVLAEAVLRHQRLLESATTTAINSASTGTTADLSKHESHQTSLHRAKLLLARLLSGEYGPFRGAVSGRTSRDYTGIIDILRTTGHPLEKLCPLLPSQRSHAKVWSNTTLATALPEGWSPVIPDLATVRIIMRGVLQERRHELFNSAAAAAAAAAAAGGGGGGGGGEYPDRAAQVGIMNLQLHPQPTRPRPSLFSPHQPPISSDTAALLDWGVAMYKHFGVSRADIDFELDGYLTHLPSQS